ncbi:hypothetical protein BgiBS90_012465 [Biomphalaria glabrata]|nr:hypothetical protein BgiBS90_012465 [Biomphalaria glabrata]
MSVFDICPKLLFDNSRRSAGWENSVLPLMIHKGKINLIVKSRELGVGSLEWRVWSGEFGLGSIEWGAWSGKFGLGSIEWGASSEELRVESLDWVDCSGELGIENLSSGTDPTRYCLIQRSKH